MSISETPASAKGSGDEPPSLRWFRYFMAAGILANVAVALVSIAFPERVLALLHLDPATPLVWPRFAAFLLILLSGFYVLALDPCRHRFASVFAMLCRFAGVAFFAVIGGRYLIFGLFDFIFGAPQAICLWLAWRHGSATTSNPAGSRVAAVLLSLLAAGAAGWMAYRWLMLPIVPAYASAEDQFKYGSIGNDAETGIPYPIWVAMPEICAQYLPRPQGYAAFGFVWDPGRDPRLDPPIGFSKARVGVDRMAINCAICHTVRVRLSAAGKPEAYLAGAANTVDIQAYQRFLARCAADDHFNADTLLPVMNAKVPLTWLERLAYRFVLIPRVKDALLEQNRSLAWAARRPLWGPGRIDPFNPVKFGMLGLVDDDTVGNSDMQAIWNLGARERLRANAPLHWDGLNISVHEVAVSSALGDGAIIHSIDFASMNKLEHFLRLLSAPTSPLRPDPAAVERGHAIFTARCAECHGAGGSRTLTVIPASEVGTDGHRLSMWTVAARDAYNGYYKSRNSRFSAFQKTDGYIAEPLVGLWLNGPYLHNGSVPSLRALLTPPAERPITFVRGLDVIDQENGGFVAPSCDPRQSLQEGFCLDTRLIGNNNGGHLYGTDLPPQQKSDLLAYLLTL
jgi:mono/diheme cytochrome c family protein